MFFNQILAEDQISNRSESSVVTLEDADKHAYR